MPGSHNSIESLLRPRSIAVVGASPHPGVGERVVNNLLEAGFAGPVYPINPRYEFVGDVRCFPSVGGLPETPDCIVLAVASQRVPAILQEAVACGVSSAVVLSSGFGELGKSGAELQQALAFLAERIQIVGPNCMGFVNLVDHVAAYSGPISGMQRGEVAVLSQSGAIGCVLVNALELRGVGLSYHISSGNEVGVGAPDYLQLLVDDPGTRIVAIYLENLARARELIEVAARGTAAGKKIIVLHAGLSEVGRRVATSHTAALTASGEVMRAACSQAGVTLVSDLDELVQCVELFSHHKGPAPGGLAVVTLSGGEAAVLGDLATSMNLPFAVFGRDTRARLQELLPSYVSLMNPLDSTGAGILEGNSRPYQAVLEVLARDKSVGVVVVAHDVHNGLNVGKDENLFLRDVVRATAYSAECTETPFVVLSPTTGPVDQAAADIATGAGVPILLGARPGLTAVKSLLSAKRPGSVPNLGERRKRGAPLLADLSERDAKVVLARYGIGFLRDIPVTSEQEARAAARKLGFPVVAKVDAEALLHKSDVGGVEVNIGDEDSAAAAYRRIMATVAARAPRAVIRSILIQPMAPPGVELLCGARVDGQFGPCVVLGSGGVFAELFDDLVIRLAPLRQRDARDMLASFKGTALLTGQRGRPRCDIEGVIEVLSALSRFICDHASSVDVVEVNPLLAPFGGRPVALDALIVRTGQQRLEKTK